MNHYQPHALFALILAAGLPAVQAQTVSLAPPHAPIVEGRAVPVVAHPDQQALLASADPALAANKRLVYDFWRSVMNAGQVERVQALLAADYLEHDVTAATGREAFERRIAARVPRRAAAPALIDDPLITMVAERDLVVLAFVREVPEPDGSGGRYTSTRFDMFRVAGGRIAEHWVSGPLPPGLNVPPAALGGPVPVTGAEGLAQLPWLRNADPLLANNKRVVFDLWRHVPDAGRQELSELYLDPIYIQHNPNAATGRDGFVQYMSRRPDVPILTHLQDPLVAVVAEADIVVQVVAAERVHPDRPGQTYRIPWFDMFRIVDGRLAEHWDSADKGEHRPVNP